MRKLPALALGGGAVLLAGAAVAATQQIHRMDVPLPDGGVVHVEYAGDVAPKVTVQPTEGTGMWAPTAFPGFGNFDAMFGQLDRQMRQMQQQIASQPTGGAGMNVAGYGSMPEGSHSVSVVTTSNNGVTCTRTTEVVSQGAGKPPKVTNKVDGNCGVAPQAAPTPPAPPINRT